MTTKISTGKQPAEHFKEVRLYQNMGYSFRLDTDKMDYLNANGFNNTIDEVMQHIPEAQAASDK